jgi:hypothetical protein
LVRFLTNLSNQSGRLRSIELGKGVLRRIWNPSTQQGVMSDDEVRSLAVRVIEELQRLNREKQSVLVLVYLPIATDYYNTSSDTWRRHFSSAARERGIPFLDLVENFRSLPPEKVEHFYIRPWDGHLSPTGNQYVAKLIYDRFLGIPQIAKKFPKKTFARGSVH